MGYRPRLPKKPNLEAAELRQRQDDYWRARHPRKIKNDPQRPSPAEIKRREKAYWEAVVTNHIPLAAEWAGWRMAGKYLVSPHGDRIAPERLLGILFAETNRARVEQSRTKRETAAKVARIHFLPARELFEGSA